MPDTYIKNGGNWSKFKKAFIKNGGTWSEIKTIWIKNGGVWSKSFVNETIVNVASQNNINLKTLYTNQTGAAPSSAVRVVYNINGNIGSASTATPALVTDTWPAGSEIVINVANGVYIRGAGGAATTNAGARNGGAGGNAISISLNVTIINNGSIGGGGGAGGGYYECISGAGCVNATGGAGAGNGTTSGTGGSTGTANYCGYGFCECGWFAYGGRGGDLGEDGVSVYGTQSNNNCSTQVGWGIGGSGGAAGKAIALNGNTATRSGSGTTLGTVS